jgi:hypothetical protein
MTIVGSKIAVVGAGIVDHLQPSRHTYGPRKTGVAGLTALKELREVGAEVTLFERRDDVGGMWSWTADTSITAALRETQICNSKYYVSVCQSTSEHSRDVDRYTDGSQRFSHWVRYGICFLRFD